ncbi:MAG: ATP-binding protein, partial [Brevundimonas sp.]
SRNQNRKGVGLGLAIARDVARGHGGDITLERSDLGGLRALIRLPG